MNWYHERNNTDDKIIIMTIKNKMIKVKDSFEEKTTWMAVILL